LFDTTGFHRGIQFNTTLQMDNHYNECTLYNILFCSLFKIYDTEYGGVGVRVYEPVNVKSDKRPVLVYYHGGGWSWLSVGK
jgi:acetyl esterase/lipase